MMFAVGLICLFDLSMLGCLVRLFVVDVVFAG